MLWVLYEKLVGQPQRDREQAARWDRAWNKQPDPLKTMKLIPGVW